MASRPVWAAEVRVPHICIMYVMDDGLSFGRSSSMDNKSYDLEKFIGEWYPLWAFSVALPKLRQSLNLTKETQNIRQ